MRRTTPLPALLMPPWRRVRPLECSDRTRPRYEIADRLVGLIRGQFTGSVQLDKVDRIPSVGLDPLVWLARDQRWRDDGAFVSRYGQLPLHAVTA
jgi:hypothetical protein